MNKKNNTLRDLCININNHQESTFHPLGNFLNPALALLGQGLRKSPSGKKLNFANHPYLYKSLFKRPNNHQESVSTQGKSCIRHKCWIKNKLQISRSCALTFMFNAGVS
ncbi:hypothetical protein [Bathymodiolus thermophilus thioautotrophic gill symbiont]|uniref:hypothetical protein n=1 Tax=Bathymodiolus thermophilus thioautotrophic gill symbiont TaxID=2360 RepID=UPI000F097330|nr:hypothetical protein [Bathymodiolus thermophilus thioautotrophic gill symbiont]